LKKDFVQKVANERLRLIADTSNNLLVSLYALYKSNFEEDFIKNPVFYENYFKKRKNQESPYFNSFSELILDNEFPLSIFLVLIVLILITIGFISYKYNIFGDKTKKLSVQERRIFELIKQGATNQDISNEVHIELSTVKTHVSNIFSKLKINSRKEIMNMK
jgi:DNA-binding CsgD family transcriptional regulator